MNIALCLSDDDGARGWRVIVAAVLILVIVLSCAGVSPEWVAASAALIGLASTKR
ncbi:hypothetical protein AB0I98_16905 [Streptomyces sp. NPDC050211]|uniref:hypothetical protein n=1 Tax=Streptomyces sp. NPDC050211 TaxID=3154932 RepID=UPI00344644AD